MGTRDARHQAYGKFLRRNAVLGCSRGEADRCGRSGPVPKVKIDPAAVVILRFPARTTFQIPPEATDPRSASLPHQLSSRGALRLHQRRERGWVAAYAVTVRIFHEHHK